MKRAISMLAAAGMCLWAIAASANTITFTSSGPSAQATFITSANTLSITVNNLTADPGSVAQCLSALFFSITTGQSSGSLTSGSGMERTIATDGTYTDGSIVAAGWALQTGPTWGLDVLASGGSGPRHTLIGGPDNSNVYGSANSSITGNGPHNPFLAGPLTFNLSISGVTVDSSINNVVFQFGTTDGSGQFPPQEVPDGGTTVFLLGLALSGLGLIRRKLS